MKAQLSTLSILTTLLISGSAVYAENANQDSKVYNIATRLGDYTRPTTFTPTEAIPVNVIGQVGSAFSSRSVSLSILAAISLP